MENVCHYCNIFDEVIKTQIPKHKKMIDVCLECWSNHLQEIGSSNIALEQWNSEKKHILKVLDEKFKRKINEK